MCNLIGGLNEMLDIKLSQNSKNLNFKRVDIQLLSNWYLKIRENPF